MKQVALVEAVRQGLAPEAVRLLAKFDVVAGAPGGVERLRELILGLAVRGELVTQDTGDEPALAVLTKVEEKRQSLAADGKASRFEALAEVGAEEAPFASPVSWLWTRFANVTVCRDGQRVPVSKDERQGRRGPYDYYGASGVIDSIDGYIFDEPLLLLGEDGANLVNRSTPIAFIATGKYWVNNHAHVLDGASLDSLRYLAVFINAIDLRPYVTGTAQPKMNQAKMNSIPVPVPPLAEQKRIVAKVDELMKLCDDLETRQTKQRETAARLNKASLDALTSAEGPEELTASWRRVAGSFDALLNKPESVDDLRRSVLELAARGCLVSQDPKDEPATALLSRAIAEKERWVAQGKMRLGNTAATEIEEPYPIPRAWSWIRVGDVFDVVGGIQKTPLRAPNANHYPYLRVENVQRGRLDLTRMERFELQEGELERKRLESGDLLVVEGNGSENEIGRCAIWDGSIDDCVHQNHLIRCRPIPPVQGPFVLLFLNSPAGMAEMKRLAVTTSGLYNLSVGKIRDIAIPVPPLAEQQRILSKVDHLMALCDALADALRRAEATAQGLADALIAELLA